MDVLYISFFFLSPQDDNGHVVPIIRLPAAHSHEKASAVAGTSSLTFVFPVNIFLCVVIKQVHKGSPMV